MEKAYQAATPKSTQRALINIGLLLGAAIPLFFLAIIATSSFYHNYVPDQVIHAPIYLQYGMGPHPFGVASLVGANLKTRQAYDVSVVLTLPESPANAERGNFMVEVHFLRSEAASTEWIKHIMTTEAAKHVDRDDVIFSCHRPALLPYKDPLVSLISRVLFLGYHLVFPSPRTFILKIPMAEQLELAPGHADLPVSVSLEVLAGQNLQTYDATVVMNAQMHGLRWIMYRYRVVSFCMATLLFWAAEMAFMVLAWILWSARQENRTAQIDNRGSLQTTAPVKHERPELGPLPDIPRGSSQAQPIASRADSRPATREWTDIKGHTLPMSSRNQADGEEEFSKDDSGIGTSYSDDVVGDMRRRMSHQRQE